MTSKYPSTSKGDYDFLKEIKEENTDQILPVKYMQPSDQ